jgi:hypothetical protein
MMNPLFQQFVQDESAAAVQPYNEKQRCDEYKQNKADEI